KKKKKKKKKRKKKKKKKNKNQKSEDQTRGYSRRKNVKVSPTLAAAAEALPSTRKSTTKEIPGSISATSSPPPVVRRPPGKTVSLTLATMELVAHRLDRAL
ncbi:MAG: hypothetical protein L6R41_006717, partial [Letrouitia leprolyta]